LNKKSSGSRSRKQILTAVGTRCTDHVTPLYPQKLALTSPTGGGCSVGIVRSRTKATEFHPLRGPVGKERHSSILSLTSAIDGVGGQRHAPAVLPQGKTRYLLCRSLGRPQGRSGRVRKISPPMDRPARSESLYLLSHPGPRTKLGANGDTA